MSTDPDVKDGAVPPDAASDAAGNADASLPASPEEIYKDTMVPLRGHHRRVAEGTRWITGQPGEDDPAVFCPDCTDGNVGPTAGLAR